MIAWLLLIILIFPVGYALWNILFPGSGPDIVMGPLVYTGGMIEDTRTGVRYDPSPWVHPNGELRFYREPIIHSLAGVTYEFYVDDIQHPVMKFVAGDNEYQVYDHDGNIVSKRLSGWWPFGRTAVVCPLPGSPCFYTPIKVSGLGGCGILMIEPGPDQPDASVTLWTAQENQWSQTPFRKDGEILWTVKGNARRHTNWHAGTDHTAGRRQAGAASK